MSGQKVQLESKEGQVFEVDRELLKQSETINAILVGWESQGKEVSSEVIPLGEIASEFLQYVLDYCEHHKEDPAPTDDDEENNDISGWDVAFLENFHNQKLFNLIMAAYNIRVMKLVGVCCQAVANLVRGKTTEEMRQIYGIQNDFTPEEEERIRLENAWCDFDDRF